ncbi:O-antigen ligase family protein [Nostoc sp. FACHB-973]|nr:O-antigen ligase family protein [Nostoc sp. FACHB-973]
MNPAINKKFNLLLYYQCALAVAAILTFFTEINSYLYKSEISTFPPLFWISAFGLASIPLIFLQFKSLLHSLITWCFGYLFISLLWFLILSIPGGIALEELKKRILSVVFLSISLLFFSQNKQSQLWARRTVLITTILAVFNNIYDFLNSLAFSSLSVLGRSAGFYINPNMAGAALVLGMIFSVSLLCPKYRIPFVLVIGLGTFLTLSRGAIFGWLVVVIIFVITRIIPRSQLLYWILGLGLIVIVLLPYFEDLPANFILEQNTLNRLEWLQQPSESEDSADSRLYIAKLGWQLFTKSPFWGNGIGSTLMWNEEISTHNMYLYLMDDHGFLGVFILPLLVYAVTRKARGETKYIAWAFSIFILLWGLFSHDILQERYILIMFSLMAAMTRTSQLEQKF